MASNILMTVQEKKDLEKYIRFFTYKAIQIIVKSRLGMRYSIPCKLFSSGSDWFYLGLTDDSGVHAAAKSCVAKVHVLATHTVNVEISLKTKEGDKMVLEVWSSHMDSYRRELVKIHFAVYMRLSILLRSLASTTRLVSGYKLSRGQSSDSFVICYRVYHGAPDLSHLGGPSKEPTTVEVGGVATPLGTVNLKVFCRSQLLFSPTSSSYEDLDVKENYFATESPPSAVKGHPLGNRHLNSQEWQKVDTTDGGVTVSASSPSDNEVAGAVTNPALRSSTKNNYHGIKDSPRDKMFRLGSSSENTDSSGSGQPNRPLEKPRRASGFAFAQRRASQTSLEEEVPFSLLLEMSQHSNTSFQTSFPSHSPPPSDDHRFVGSLLDDAEFMDQYDEDDAPPDDFELLDVKTPFAVPDSEEDLGRVYKKFQNKVDLELLHSGPTIAETLQDLNLEHFEKEMADFDDFCEQLSISPANFCAQGSPV